MSMRSTRPAVVWLLAVLTLCTLRSDAYQDGDYVAIARRGQFHEVRTHWHDLLGRHCPHFGVDRVVAVPIPQPHGFKAVDGYKISFSLAGDRLYTRWLKVIGGSAPSVPMVDMMLTRMGNDIKSVAAQVVDMSEHSVEVVDVPEHYVERHKLLVEEFGNSTHWPKHLLVEYRWKEQHEVNAIPGMYVLFVTALVLAVNALAGQGDRLRDIVGEITGEDTIGPPGGARWGTPEALAASPVYRPPTGPKDA